MSFLANDTYDIADEPLSGASFSTRLQRSADTRLQQREQARLAREQLELQQVFYHLSFFIC